MKENEEIRLREELNSYFSNNSNYINELYIKYLELTDKLKIEVNSIWSKDQLASIMMLAEQNYANLIERVELQLYQNGLDPFDRPKLATYIIGGNSNGTIAFIYTRIERKGIFMIEEMQADILEAAKKNSLPQINNTNDFNCFD